MPISSNSGTINITTQHIFGGGSPSSGPAWSGNSLKADPNVVNSQQASKKYNYLTGGQAEFMQLRSQKMEAARQQKAYADAQGEKGGGKGSETSKFQKSSLAVLTKLVGPLGAGGLLAQSKLAGTVTNTFFKLIGALVDIILAPLIPLLVPVLKFFGSMIKTVADLIQAIKEKGWMTALIDFFKTMVTEQDWSMVAVVISALLLSGAVLGKLYEIFTGTVPEILDWKSLVVKLRKAFEDSGEWVGKSITAAISKTMKFSKEAWKNLPENISSIITFADKAFDTIVDKIGSTIKFADSKMGEIITAITDFLGKDGTWDWGEQIMDKLSPILSSSISKTIANITVPAALAYGATRLYLNARDVIHEKKNPRAIIAAESKTLSLKDRNQIFTDFLKSIKYTKGMKGMSDADVEAADKASGLPLSVTAANMIELLLKIPEQELTRVDEELVQIILRTIKNIKEKREDALRVSPLAPPFLPQSF